MRNLLIAVAAGFALGACETIRSTPTLADMPGGDGPTQITVASGDNVIQGEIHRLKGTSPKTVVIIVGGSSVRTRADTAAAIPIFINEETAVVVYDRRGNGKSTGSFVIPDTDNSEWQVPLFSDDVADIVAYLKSAGFTRVGLLGSSMGAWVNVSAAAQSPAIDYIVCISGGGSSVGVSDEFDRLTDEGMTIGEAIDAARTYDGIQGYNPANDLTRIAQPALWIFGAMDDSNPTRIDADNIKTLRAQGKRFDIILLENTNHELIDATTGEMNLDWIEPVRQFISGE